MAPKYGGGRGRSSGSFVSAPEQSRLDSRKRAGSQLTSESTAYDVIDPSELMDRTKRRLSEHDSEMGEEDEEEDELDGPGKKKHSNKSNATSTGRKKIDIEFIPEKAKRTVSFTKRKAGLMKKAFELSTLTGTQCLVLVVSESGLVYTYATEKFKPLVELPSGKRFIQRALNGSQPLYDSLVDGDSVNASTRDDIRLEDEMELEDMIVPHPTKRARENQGERGHHFQFRSPLELIADALVKDGNYVGGSGKAASEVSPDFPSSSFLPLDISNLPVPIISNSRLVSQSSAGAIDQLGTAEQLALNQGRLFPAYIQTPYERASAEHAIALASYQASQQFIPPVTSAYPPSSVGPSSVKRASYGAHSFSEAARSRFSNGSGSGKSSPTWMSEERSVRTDLEEIMPLQSSTDLVIESRKKGWQSLASSALIAARRTPTITHFLEAYSNYRQTTYNLPSALPSGSTTYPAAYPVFEDKALSSLRDTCQELGIVEGSQLPSAIRTMLARITLDSESNTNSTRSCLISMSEFLFNNSLISSIERAEIMILATPVAPTSSALFDLNHQDPTSVGGLQNWNYDQVEIEESVDDRKNKVGRLFEQHVRESQFITGNAAGKRDNGVVGWFSIYRTRETYVVLKELTLEGNSIANGLLSPFKLRVPPILAALLKIDDSVELSIVSVESGEGKRYWLPRSFSGFTAATDLNAQESDVDVESYSLELKRLLSDSEAQTNPIHKEEIEGQIRLNRSIIDELNRSTAILAEGEF